MNSVTVPVPYLLELVLLNSEVNKLLKISSSITSLTKNQEEENKFTELQLLIENAFTSAYEINKNTFSEEAQEKIAPLLRFLEYHYKELVILEHTIKTRIKENHGSNIR